MSFTNLLIRTVNNQTKHNTAHFHEARKCPRPFSVHVPTPRGSTTVLSSVAAGPDPDVREAHSTAQNPPPPHPPHLASQAVRGGRGARPWRLGVRAAAFLPRVKQQLPHAHTVTHTPRPSSRSLVREHFRLFGWDAMDVFINLFCGQMFLFSLDKYLEWNPWVWDRTFV